MPKIEIECDPSKKDIIIGIVEILTGNKEETIAINNINGNKIKISIPLQENDLMRLPLKTLEANIVEVGAYSTEFPDQE